jgi:predicted Rossmann fold flavoprotein
MHPEPLPVVVAGGGPAGFMAAIVAAEAGLQGVHLLEATPEPLSKVRISGGGRCNVTHACWDPAELVTRYPRGSRALRGPFSRFATGDALAWFDDHGLELVEEPDGRLFPRSNRSSSVVDTLRRAAQRAGVTLHTCLALKAATPAAQGFVLQLRGRTQPLTAAQLVLATGSHPSGRRSSRPAAGPGSGWRAAGGRQRR